MRTNPLMLLTIATGMAWMCMVSSCVAQITVPMLTITPPVASQPVDKATSAATKLGNYAACKTDLDCKTQLARLRKELAQCETTDGCPERSAHMFRLQRRLEN